MSPTSFFLATEKPSEFRATEATRGPWSPEHQHAGPPAALLARALEGVASNGADERRIVRFTVEILKPIPIEELRVEVRVARSGRSVELLEGALHSTSQEILRARAWRMRESESELDAYVPEPDRRALPSHEKGRRVPFFPTLAGVGYHTSMEWRFFAGGFNDPGPGRAWLRMKIPLLPGEEPSPLVRSIVAADSGNGVSSPLDYQRYLFVNTDLTVQLYREPRGEWIGLDSRSNVEPTGIGTTITALHDADGSVGRALQTLFVARRPST